MVKFKTMDRPSTSLIVFWFGWVIFLHAQLLAQAQRTNGLRERGQAISKSSTLRLQSPDGLTQSSQIQRSGYNIQQSRDTPTSPISRARSAVTRRQTISNRSDESRRQTIPSRSAVSRRQTIPHRSAVTRRQTIPNRSAESRRQTIPSRSAVSRRQTIPHRSAVTRRQTIPNRSAESRRQTIPSRSAVSRRQTIPHRSAVTRRQTIPNRSAESRRRNIPTGSAVSRRQTLPAGSLVSRRQTLPESNVNRLLSVPRQRSRSFPTGRESNRPPLASIIRNQNIASFNGNRRSPTKSSSNSNTNWQLTRSGSSNIPPQTFTNKNRETVNINEDRRSSLRKHRTHPRNGNRHRLVYPPRSSVTPSQAFAIRNRASLNSRPFPPLQQTPLLRPRQFSPRDRSTTLSSERRMVLNRANEKKTQLRQNPDVIHIDELFEILQTVTKSLNSPNRNHNKHSLGNNTNTRNKMQQLDANADKVLPAQKSGISRKLTTADIRKRIPQAIDHFAKFVSNTSANAATNNNSNLPGRKNEAINNKLDVALLKLIAATSDVNVNATGENQVQRAQDINLLQRLLGTYSKALTGPNAGRGQQESEIATLLADTRRTLNEEAREMLEQIQTKRNRIAK